MEGLISRQWNKQPLPAFQLQRHEHRHPGLRVTPMASVSVCEEVSTMKKTLSSMSLVALLAGLAPSVASAKPVTRGSTPTLEQSATPSSGAGQLKWLRTKEGRQEEQAADQRTSMWIAEEWQAANR